MSPEELQRVRNNPDIIVCDECKVVSIIPERGERKSLGAVVIHQKRRRHYARTIQTASVEQIESLADFDLVDQSFLTKRQKL